MNKGDRGPAESNTADTLTFFERLGAWLIVCLFAFIILLNLYLNDMELPEKQEDVPVMIPSLVEVTIKGAVKHPGVYQLEKGTSVEEALALAEPLDYADLSRVKKGSKIVRRRTMIVPGNST